MKRTDAQIPMAFFRSSTVVLRSWLLLGVVGCGGDIITTPDPFRGGPCVLPAELLAGATPQPFALADLRDAFLHAAGPLTSALGSSEPVGALRNALTELGSEAGARSTDTTCRLLATADEALRAIREPRHTEPERDAIRLVLILAAGSVRRAGP